ncbi:MAG: LiaF transmembrane domain-containing protein [Tissierella sp.]|uniref:LiaF transmembrane domain-containing protein n=1 Tax=Tissierella sp. TaxID=41274 RepID=UPI003F949649
MKDRSIFGIILVLLGIGFLLEQFDIISFNNIISSYWPIILIVIGVVGLLKKGSSKIGNAILLILGILFQVRNLGLIDINLFKLFWPIILIIIGVNIIFSKNKVSNNEDFRDSSDGMSARVSLEDRIDEFVILSGMEINIGSQEFKGGKITAIMGGVELDLRDAKLHNNKATININTVMGGAEIHIPETWKVEHSGTPILGGFSSKKRVKIDSNSPVLKINYTLIMGGIEVK